MGFGVEIFFAFSRAHGIVLGPKRLHKILEPVARARAMFENASRDFKPRLAAELKAPGGDRSNDDRHDTPGGFDNRFTDLMTSEYSCRR